MEHHADDELPELQNLKDLIDSVPTGIGIYEIKDGNIFLDYINNAYYEMLGYSRENRSKYLGSNTLKVAHEEDVPKITAAIQSLIKGEDKTNFTYRVRMENGEWFWMHLCASVVERKENYLKIYASFADYNKIIQTQRELERSEDTLSVALKSAKVLAWCYDYKQDKVTDSNSLGVIFNLPKEFFSPCQTVLDLGFISPESKKDFRQLYEDVKSENVATAVIKTTVTSEQGAKWFKQIYTPTFDEKGNYIDSIGIAIDITDQKIKEQRYEELLNLNKLSSKKAIATAIYNLSKNTVTACECPDPAVAELFHYDTADELLSSTKVTIFDPEERAKFDIVSDSKTMIKAFRKGITHFEIRHHIKESTRWFLTTFDMIENPYTSDVEAISAVNDITDFVRSEKTVNQLMAVEYQAIMIIDSKTGDVSPFETNHEDKNLTEIMELQKVAGSGNLGQETFLRKYLVSENVEKVIEENSLEYVKQKLETLPFYENSYSLMQDNRIQRFRIMYSYFEGDKGVLLCAVQNITALYEQEEKQKAELSKALKEAEAANNAKTAFLSRVSHDMRTPLNGILGLTTLLKGSVTDLKISKDLCELELSGKYLLNLINDTLDVSRIESGKLELHPSVCDGKTLFENAISLSNSTVQEKNIKLNVHADNIPFTMLYVDVERLQQVILNVLSNAIKFSNFGGTIDVNLESISFEDGVITDKFTVKDYGIGMSKDFLPHIFEPFSQEDSSRTSSYQGTGLGMSITKKLLTLTGGDIFVESEKGKGTCVTMIIKLKTATKEQVDDWKKSQSNNYKKTSLKGKRVLLCEDNELNAEIIQRLLELKGVTVEHAKNGKIGVEMFTLSKPHYYNAVLMDIRMPVMDGLDAAKNIRSLNRVDSSSVPIIAMTANAFPEDIKQTKDAGMNVHLSKPIQADVFYKTLEDITRD